MNDIPTFIEFNPQDKSHSINDDLNASFNTSLLELDSFHDEAEYHASITDKDLIDMKAMIRDLKSNPSLIYEKFSLPKVNESMVFGAEGPNKSNGATDKGSSPVEQEMPSPQPRRPQYCQDCESPNTLASDCPKINLKKRDLCSFPRLPGM